MVLEAVARVSRCWAVELGLYFAQVAVEFVVCRFEQVIVSRHMTRLNSEREVVASTEQHTRMLDRWAAAPVMCFEEQAGFYHMTARNSGPEKLMMANYRLTDTATCDEHELELECTSCYQAIAFVSRSGFAVAMYCWSLEYVSAFENNVIVPGRRASESAKL